MSNLSDLALASAVARHDAQALGELYDRHSRAVFLYALGNTRNREDALDLVQDVFITAWRRGQIRIAGESALPWLLVTAKYLMRNLARKKHRERTVPLIEIDQVQRDEPSARLVLAMSAINQLAELDQRVCQLCLIDGYSYDEASRLLGITQPALRKRVERIRKRLRAIGGSAL